ncbi:MAG: HAMP domain-containing sensor histidine kinase [Patescibacteria group bacterium]
MDTGKVFGKSALVYSLLLFIVGALLSFLVHFDNKINQILPFLPSWGVLAFSIITFLILAVIFWTRERRFEVLKYEFVNIVTHKFRTPLTYITWSIENLKKNQTPDERNESIRQIEAASSRLTELTDILIDLVRIDEGYSYVFKAQYFREIIESILKQYADQLREKQIHFNIEIAQGIPLIAVDVKRIEFVIKVLMENALAYTPVGGHISIALELMNQKSIRFTIKDSGIGISKNDISHVFSKFFRSHEATGADTEGMGLGLYISENIIKRHGGKIWAESGGLHKGSTFMFEIPLNHGR